MKEREMPASLERKPLAFKERREKYLENFIEKIFSLFEKILS